METQEVTPTRDLALIRANARIPTLRWVGPLGMEPRPHLIVALGAREIHSNPSFDADPRKRSDSNSSAGSLGEGDPPMKLLWVVTLGTQNVNSNPSFDADPDKHSDSNSPLGTIREGTPPVNA